MIHKFSFKKFAREVGKLLKFEFEFDFKFYDNNFYSFFNRKKKKSVQVNWIK